MDVTSEYQMSEWLRDHEDEVNKFDILMEILFQTPRESKVLPPAWKMDADHFCLFSDPRGQRSPRRRKRRRKRKRNKRRKRKKSRKMSGRRGGGPRCSGCGWRWSRPTRRPSKRRKKPTSWPCSQFPK